MGSGDEAAGGRAIFLVDARDCCGSFCVCCCNINNLVIWLGMPERSEAWERSVPRAFQAKCEFCGLLLDTRAEGSCQWVSGWVKVRAGGGGHGISLPVRADRWAHWDCVERETNGLGGQGSMF